MIIRDFLNKLKWDPAYQEKNKYFDLIYIHRGAPNDEVRVNCSEIKETKSDRFLYDDFETGFEKIIPYHRILQIIDIRSDEIIYKKASKE